MIQYLKYLAHIVVFGQMIHSFECASECRAVIPYSTSSLLRDFQEDFKNVVLGGYRYQLKQKWNQNGVSGVLWDSALVLARYVHIHQNVFRDRKVLELGAGLGLPSLVASRCGAKRVLSTDLEQALPLLMENIERNRPKDVDIEVTALDWQGVKPKPNFDVILGADLVYIEDLFEPLKATIEWFALPDVVILLSSKIRYPKDESFYNNLAKSGFDVEKVLYDKETDIHIFRVTKAKKVLQNEKPYSRFKTFSHCEKEPDKEFEL